jgi:hypothetical protein
MRMLTACLLWALLAVAAAHGQAQTHQRPRRVHHIHLVEKSAISDAAAVDGAINVMARNVASCSPALAKDPQGCACSFRDDMEKLKAAYAVAVARHAAWNADNTVVSYDKPATGTSVTISFPALKRQIDACAKR